MVKYMAVGMAGIFRRYGENMGGVQGSTVYDRSMAGGIERDMEGGIAGGMAGVWQEYSRRYGWRYGASLTGGMAKGIHCFKNPWEFQVCTREVEWKTHLYQAPYLNNVQVYTRICPAIYQDNSSFLQRRIEPATFGTAGEDTTNRAAYAF